MFSEGIVDPWSTITAECSNILKSETVVNHLFFYAYNFMIFYNLLSTPWQVVELKSPTFLNHPKNEFSNMLLPGE